MSEQYSKLLKFADEYLISVGHMWRHKPDGWDAGSVHQFSDTLTEKSEHPFTRCMEKIKDVKEITDKKRFCGSVKSNISKKKKKKK